MKENKVTSASVSSYFSNNLQQIGFSSPIKAVLTTLKEAIDNSLDACEEADILPDLKITVEKIGQGSMKNTDKIRIVVEDNGPGISEDFLPKVFGEFLASSKFGRGRCTRGQQGLGISASVAWAQLTNARGVFVTSKTKKDKKAVSCVVEVDIKNNQGIVKDKKKIDWDRSHGTSVEFILDGKIQVNGEAGILTYLVGTSLLNPHMSLTYTLPDMAPVVSERVVSTTPEIPQAVNPHPHTMKLGEFISHAHLFNHLRVRQWLKESFSRIGDADLRKLQDAKLGKVLNSKVEEVKSEDFKALFAAIQNLNLQAPSTRSLLTIGEDSLSKSILRLGPVDFFSVISRKPAICDFKPVQVEVAIARLSSRGGEDTPVQTLRFANRVPLQFDKSSCVTTKAIETVNWRSYGLSQPKDSLPLGPYIFAVSVVSPFIKFKNASKETIDASDELTEEIRRALIQAGQKLAKFVRKEAKEADLEAKRQYIEQFSPILVDCLFEITSEPKSRKLKIEKGLKKILGRDTDEMETELENNQKKIDKELNNGKK